MARLIGMSEDKIRALEPGGDATLFSAEELAILRFVDEVVGEGGASQSAFDAVGELMSPAEMIEMTVVIGVYVLVSQVCATFGIEPEEVPIDNTGIDEIRNAVSRLD